MDSRMPQKCHLVRSLKEIKESSSQQADEGLSYVASAALNIIKDVSEGSLKSMDIPCLADLVVEIENEGYGESLFTHLQDSTHDCHICTALAAHLDARGR